MTMDSAAKKIMSRIKRNKRGWAFTPKDFLDLSTRQNIDFVLHRLVKQGTIRRLSRGLYDYPAKHYLLGTLAADSGAIANAVARSHNDTVHMSDAVAANTLHLTTQVPAKVVYITRHTKKTIHIGNRLISLMPTKLPLDDKNGRTTMVLQALNYFGRYGIDDNIISRCRAILGDKDRQALLKLSTQVRGAWLADAIREISA